jgi:hypothetical protein
LSARLPILGVLVVACVRPGVASAETLVFKDPRRGEVRGQVLAEFDELLYVRLDGERSPGFVARAELAAVVGDDGRRFDAPPSGTFAPYRSMTPAAALVEVVGEAWALKGAGKAERVAEGPAFLSAGEGVRTGDGGLLLLALPSGAEVRLGPSGEAALPPGRAESLRLVRG